MLRHQRKDTQILSHYYPGCPISTRSLSHFSQRRVKIGGGVVGVGPPWKTDNPHCKRQGKKLGGSGFDPPWA